MFHLHLATCEDPGVVANGQRKGDTFIDGDSIEFTCDENYSLIGSSIIRCLGGKWSSALPHCKGTKLEQLPFSSHQSIGEISSMDVIVSSKVGL